MCNVKIYLFSMFTAHIRSNGSHFLTAGLWRNEDTKSLKLYLYIIVFHIDSAYKRLILIEVTMISLCTAHISSNGSHFLTARLS